MSLSNDRAVEKNEKPDNGHNISTAPQPPNNVSVRFLLNILIALGAHVYRINLACV